MLEFEQLACHPIFRAKFHFSYFSSDAVSGQRVSSAKKWKRPFLYRISKQTILTVNIFSYLDPFSRVSKNFFGSSFSHLNRKIKQQGWRDQIFSTARSDNYFDYFQSKYHCYRKSFNCLFMSIVLGQY